MEHRNSINTLHSPGPHTAGRRFCAVPPFCAAGANPWRKANSLRPSIELSPGIQKEAPAVGWCFFLEATPRFELGNRSFADSCLTTWLCRRNAVISISDIDYIKYGLICQALFKNYSKIFYEFKKRVYLFISLPIFLSAIEIVPSLLLINSIYLSSSKYSTGTVISMPVSVFIF